MAEITLYKSPAKAARIFLLTLPFVLGGFFLIANGKPASDDKLWGWVCVCFFGLGIPVGLMQLFDRRPQVILNNEGIWDRAAKAGIINWNAIQGAHIITIQRQRFICLELDDAVAVSLKANKLLAELNKMAGGESVNILVSSLKVDGDKLFTLINSMIEPEADKEALLNAAKHDWQ
jgi:hypothetical protein